MQKCSVLHRIIIIYYWLFDVNIYLVEVLLNFYFCQMVVLKLGKITQVKNQVKT